MPTVLGIINRSLTEIAARQPITGEYPEFDGSAAAVAAVQLYIPAVETLLRQQDWEFSRVVQPLVVMDATPPLGWLYQYVYPDTCLRVRQIVPPTYDQNDPTAVTWDVGNIVTLGIIASSIAAAGSSGYAANDTGTILGTTGTPATYKVLTVSGGGAVLTYAIINPGSGYSFVPGGNATLPGGTQPGVGSGLVIEIITTTERSERVIWTNEGQPLVQGIISASALSFSGTGYAIGDTGVVLLQTGAQATYLILAVSAGAVTSYTISAAGSGYSTGLKPTQPGGSQPGVGTGFIINVTAVASGAAPDSVPAGIVMTTSATMELDWDPMFAETMVRYLGSMLAMPVGGRPDFSRELLGQAGGLGQAGRDRDS